MAKKIDFRFFVDLSVLGSPEPKKVVFGKCLYVCMYVCLYVCLYAELEPKPLDRFWPNLHKTCEVGPYRCTRRVFEIFSKLTAILAKKLPKNSFLIFYEKTALTILIKLKRNIALRGPYNIYFFQKNLTNSFFVIYKKVKKIRGARLCATSNEEPAVCNVKWRWEFRYFSRSNDSRYKLVLSYINNLLTLQCY